MEYVEILKGHNVIGINFIHIGFILKLFRILGR